MFMWGIRQQLSSSDFQIESSGFSTNGEVERATPTNARTHPALDDTNLSQAFSTLVFWGWQ